LFSHATQPPWSAGFQPAGPQASGLRVAHAAWEGCGPAGRRPALHSARFVSSPSSANRSSRSSSPRRSATRRRV